MTVITKNLLAVATDPGAWTPTVAASVVGTVGVADSDTISTHTDTTALEMKISGRNKSGASFWTWAGTWEDLGVPAGSIVTQVNVSYDWHCSQYTTGAPSSCGPAELRDSADVLISALTGSTGFAITGIGAWATQAGTTTANVPTAQQASNSVIHLRLNNNLATGGSNTAVVTIRQAFVHFTITYTVGALIVTPAGLGSSGGFGTPTVSPGGVSTPVTGLTSSAAFGAAHTAVTAAVTGLTSSAAFGTPTARSSITDPVVGLGSSAAFGSVTVRSGGVLQAVTGLGSSAAFGTPTATLAGGGPQSASVTGLASSASFGTPTVHASVIKTVPALPSSVAFGSPVVYSTNTAAPSGLSSSAAFGVVTPSGGGGGTSGNGKHKQKLSIAIQIGV